MPETPGKKLKIGVGESYVWLTAMGLTIGLCMIVYLLGLVLVKGASAFWPREVVQIILSEDSENQILGSNIVAGEITLTQKKHSLEQSESGGHEIQLFVGNRDAYGFSFQFFDEAEIEEQAKPEDIVRLERLEDGPAIGYFEKLVFSNGEEIAANSDGFQNAMTTLVEEVEERWETIRKIEQNQIGRINLKLEKLDRAERSLTNRETPDPAKLQEIEEQRSELFNEYETLANEAGELRELQEEDFVYLNLATGQETIIPTGQILEFYYPNELGTSGRLGLFVSNAWKFLKDSPRNANTEGGIFPAIFGTFVMTLLMSVAVMPFGVIAAIYLREYATQGPVVRMVRIAIYNLAGVPSIVFGVFGLGFFVYFVGGTIDSLFFSSSLPTPTFGTGGILWASLTLALMTVPVVIVASEEALAAVPRGAREGSLACGASKWQTIQRIVLPASAPGILTGLVLAMARGAGEVAPLMLVGVVKLAPALPLDTVYPFIHLDQKFMHLGFHIYDLGFQSPDAEAAKPMVFATTLFLIGLVVVMNLAAIFIRERLRRKYATGAF